MYDVTTRLAVAYGLIGLLVLTALALILWNMRNSWHRRDARSRARLAKRHQARDEARAAESARADDGSGGRNTVGMSG